MTPEKLQSIAFKWFESFNNKELEKLLSLYDDDAVHFSPKKMQHPESDVLLAAKKLCVAGGKMLLNVYPV
jgi:ketosteroid isomerase-like protein